MQQADWKKVARRVRCPMTCRRVLEGKKKVGLSGLPELPSEGSMIRLKSASEAAKRKVASMSVQRRRGSPGEFRAVMDPYTQARCLGGQRYLKRKKKKSVMLLTCSGADRIESTISVLPIS